LKNLGREKKTRGKSDGPPNRRSINGSLREKAVISTTSHKEKEKGGDLKPILWELTHRSRKRVHPSEGEKLRIETNREKKFTGRVKLPEEKKKNKPVRADRTSGGKQRKNNVKRHGAPTSNQ